MTKNEKTAATIAALALLLWWLKPKEVVTAQLNFEGVVDDTE